MPVVDNIACDFEGARGGRNLGESGGMLRQKIFKFRVSEMATPGFSAGHFQ